MTDTCSNVPPTLFFYTRYFCGPALTGIQQGGSTGAALTDAPEEVFVDMIPVDDFGMKA